jgi:hypothetical protein
MAPNWTITRTVDAGGQRNVSTVGEVSAESAEAALILASRLGDCATFTGTKTRGEFRWGDVCYRATPCRPNKPRGDSHAVKEARKRAALAEFFPALRHA